MNETIRMEEKILSLLSFASKMGKLIYGKEPLERHLNEKGKKILFLASDCSTNTQKFWINKCKTSQSELFHFQNITRKELARRLGKKELSAVSTSNRDIIKGIRKLVEKS